MPYPRAAGRHDSEACSPYERLLLPLLTLPDPELAHHLVLVALRLAGTLPGLAPAVARCLARPDPRLRVSLAGLEMAHPIGLAAGFDKNGVAVPMLAALGFSHVEVGTVTPRPQPGRPRPRLFRLKDDRALINRLGFPSEGAAAVASRLGHKRRPPGVLGVNIGPNASSVKRGAAVEDFVEAYLRLAPVADYIALNVSSPNTAGLRGMQGSTSLSALLDALARARQAGSHPPLLVKLAPDLGDDDLHAIMDTVVDRGVAAVIAGNTTVARPSTLRGRYAVEQGGLSGAPLHERSRAMIRAIYRYTEGKLPIVGVGGIARADEALASIGAGASLLQLYTGFIYQGPLVAYQLTRGIARFLSKEGLRTVEALVGRDA